MAANNPFRAKHNHPDADGDTLELLAAVEARRRASSAARIGRPSISSGPRIKKEESDEETLANSAKKKDGAKSAVLKRGEVKMEKGESTLVKVKDEADAKVKKEELDEGPLDNSVKHLDGTSNQLPKRGFKGEKLAGTTLLKVKDEDDDKVKKIKKEELVEAVQVPARRKDPQFDEDARRLRDARRNGVYVPAGAVNVDPVQAKKDELAKDVANLEKRMASETWEYPQNRHAMKNADLREWCSTESFTKDMTLSRTQLTLGTGQLSRKI